MLGLNLWKTKKGKTFLNNFIKIVNVSNRKPNKLWVDQERAIYDKLMQGCLDNNDILMHLPTLIHINRYSTDTQNVERKNRRCSWKIPNVSGLVTPAVLKTKTSQVENKTLDASSLVTTTFLI